MRNKIIQRDGSVLFNPAITVSSPKALAICYALIPRQSIVFWRCIIRNFALSFCRGWYHFNISHMHIIIAIHFSLVILVSRVATRLDKMALFAKAVSNRSRDLKPYFEVTHGPYTMTNRAKSLISSKTSSALAFVEDSTVNHVGQTKASES